jgi:hypothetical protein
LIDNVDAGDKLFKFVYVPNSDKPDVVILPTTFNVDIHIHALFKTVVPEIFKVLIIVVVLFNNVKPLTFNELFIVVEPETRAFWESR